MFSDLPELLPPGTLLVGNNSRVAAARLYGVKPSGGRVEFLLLTPPPLIEPIERPGGWHEADVEGLLRASKPTRPGTELIFSDDLRLIVGDKGAFGRISGRLIWRGELHALIDRLGWMPLPPYIKRDGVESEQTEDRARYQTVYARADKAGSAAAPTAGLHFTDELRGRLDERSIGWAEVTLYVGYGTFSPVRTQDIREHTMHAEYIEIDEENAASIAAAKAEGRPVTAVGTTSVRTLESVHALRGRIEPFAGWTDLYLYPGAQFHVVDHMITNFHLPGSSLLIMVSAFSGREIMLDAYRRALDEGFRFFSYGDAMLIL